HIEARLNPKRPTGFIKTPLPFAAVAEAEPLRDLARALDEFLGMEHHAAVQGKLALFLLPFARRVQTGRCLPLRCLSVAENGKRLAVTCALDYAAAGLDPAMRLGSRIKPGDWMLLNSLDRQHPRQIIGRRIAVVREMGTRPTPNPAPSADGEGRPPGEIGVPLYAVISPRDLPLSISDG